MKPDPLAEAAAEEDLRNCKHPNLHFQNAGHRLRCVDCARYWIAGWKDPKGMETAITDFMYRNPEILDTEYRHSPNEAQRRTKLAK